MNCTKITPALPYFENFFYYFSNCTLFATVAITPLQFYVILTQSKNLKTFKWLILNHSFWCFLFEICFTSVKPVFLTPAIAGFPLGLFKNGSMKLSTAGMLIGINILIISIGALSATLLSRYLLVFPSSTKWFNKKRGIIFVTIICLILSGGICIVFYKFLNTEDSKSYQMALEYDPCMKNYFSEPGFAFLSRETYLYVFYLMFVVLIGMIIVAILIIAYFFYLVKTNTTASVTKLSKSLMISAAVQLLVTLFFNFIPITHYVAIIAFEIQNPINATLIGECIFSCHAFLEAVVTLTFIKPYRNYITMIFGKLFFRFYLKQASVSPPIIIHAKSSFNYSQRIFRNKS